VEESRPADTDWLSDLSEMIASVQTHEDEALAPESLPDWLEAERPEQEDSPVDEGDDLLAWLREIKAMEPVEAEEQAVAQEWAGVEEQDADEDLPQWLRRATGPLQEEAQDSAATPWATEEETSAAAGESAESVPEWVSELSSAREWPETADDAAVADWFAHQEEDVAEIEQDLPDLPMTQPLNPTKELQGVPEQIASESLPEWLSDQIEEAPAESAPGDDSLDQESGDYIKPVEEAVQELKSIEGGEQQEELPDWTASPEGQATGLPPSLKDEWLASSEDAPAPAEEGIELETAENSSREAEKVHDAEIPAWLLALKPGVSNGAATMLPEESSGPLSGLRGVILVAPLITRPAQEVQAAPFTESKEQQQQIALLQQLTTVGPDGADGPGEQSSGAMFAVARILLGSALLIFAILGWLLPSLGVALPLPAPSEVPEAARETYTTVNNSSGQTALVAFEYTPALAGELDAVAGTLLRHLADNGSMIITVSQMAAGTAVAERVVSETEGLESHSLGFIPGEAIGLRQLADCLEDSSTCQMLSSRSVDEVIQVGLEDVRLIVVLAGERDGLRKWIEQVGTQSDSAMVAGVAQQLGPIAAPYMASEQLAGYLNGLPAAAAYEQRLRGNEEYGVEWLTSLTLVHWLVIAVLTVGSLYFGLMGLASTRAGKASLK
jgi:chemotaxis protein histidine kinase CheA